MIDYTIIILGGGFGLEGALKGAATAGALNFATDLLYDIGKDIKNSKNDKMLASNLLKIQNDNSTIQSLKKSVHDYVLRLFNVCLKLYAEFDGAYVSTIDIDKSKGYFESAQSVPEKREELLFKALEANPTDENIYTTILNEYYDEDNELEKLAIEIAGINLRKEKLMKIEEYICTQNYVVGFKADECINKIKIISEKLGVDASNYIKIIGEINKIIKDSELTVDGVVYYNQTEADNAKQELASFIEKYKRMENLSEETLIALLEELNACVFLSKNKYIETIEKEIRNYDEYARTYKGTIYSTREEADKAMKFIKECSDVLAVVSHSKEEEVKKYENIDALTSNCAFKEEALKYVETTINAIQELEDNICDIPVGISRIEANKIINNVTRLKGKYSCAGFVSDKFEEWYSKVDKEYRTVFGIEFVSYIDADNEYYSCIEKAVKYESYIEKKQANGNKKKLFSSLKDAWGDAVQAGNQKAYNRVTKEGTAAIPFVNLEDRKKAIDMDVETKNSEANTYYVYADKYRKLMEKTEKKPYAFTLKINKVIPTEIDKASICKLVNGICEYTAVGVKETNKKKIDNKTIFDKIDGTINGCFKEDNGMISVWVQLNDCELYIGNEICVGDNLCKLLLTGITNVEGDIRILKTKYSGDLEALKKQTFRKVLYD